MSYQWPGPRSSLFIRRRDIPPVPPRPHPTPVLKLGVVRQQARGKNENARKSAPLRPFTARWIGWYGEAHRQELGAENKNLGDLADYTFHAVEAALCNGKRAVAGPLSLKP
jgi:hypothetical protein